MSELLGEATVLIRPDTTKFRAMLEEQLLLATRGLKVAVPVAPILAGGKIGAAANLAGAGAAEENAAAHGLLAEEAARAGRAQAVAATIAAEEAAAQRAAAKAAAESAAAHEAFGRGAGAAGLTLFGLRGATLAASGAFLAGTASIEIARKSVEAFTAEQEAAATLVRTFGDETAASLEKAARGFASFGLSTAEADKFLGKFGITLQNLGFGADQVTDLSERFVKLAVDLATVAHVPVEQVLKGLQVAVTGNLRGLRQFGVVIRQADITTRALGETGKKSARDLTTLEIATARNELIFRNTAFAAGAFEAQSSHLSQQTRVLKAQTENLAASLGGVLVPVLTEITGDLVLTARGITILVDKFHDLRGAVEDFIPGGRTTGHVLKDIALFGTPIIGEFNLAREAIRHFTDEGSKSAKRIKEIEKELRALKRQLPIKGLVDPGAETQVAALRYTIRKLETELDDLRAAQDRERSSGYDMKALFDLLPPSIDSTFAALARGESIVEIVAGDFKFLGQAASSAARVTVASVDAINAAIEDSINKAIIAGRQADELGIRERGAARLAREAGKPGSEEALRAARAAQAQEITAAQAIKDQRAADAKRAADEARRKAEEAARAAKEQRDKEDQALLDIIGVAEQRRQNAIQKAQQTESLRDDLEALTAYRHYLLTRALHDAERIHDLRLRRQTLREIRQEAFETQLEVAQTRKALADQVRQDRLDALARRKESLELDIQLAQARGQAAAEIRAREAYIRFLQKQAKAVKAQSNAHKQLLIEIANERKAVRDLKKELQKSKEDASDLLNFLQTQTGFAATILSNILPTGAFAGTVGGTTGGAVSTPTPVGPGGVFGETPARRGQAALLERGQLATGGQRAVTQGQIATLIQVNRQMLRVLIRLAGGRQHPEAGYQQTEVSAYMGTH